MFHLQSLELVHWDYCQRLNLPLDGAIITVAGPNGSGKTTLLDAMRTLLGLECSGGRSFKTYARHANADSVWLRACVDNRPRNRQLSSRPFARNLIHSDQVTLACRIDRNGGDWQRRYLMAEGDVSIEDLVQRPEKEWLGVENWRRRLEGAGLSRAIARVLALEQGQTDRLCEYSPRELLRLVFDVFGDQEVLDRYDEARRHQQAVASEVEQVERELVHGEAQLSQLEARVNLYRQYLDKQSERTRLEAEVVPVLSWVEEREALLHRARELHAQRLAQSALLRQQAEDRRALHALAQKVQAEQEALQTLEQERAEAQQALNDRAAEMRPIEQLLQHERELQDLARIETNDTELQDRATNLTERKLVLEEQVSEITRERARAQSALESLQGQRQPPAPADVQSFRRELRAAGIEHQVLAELIEVTDPRWQAAVEGVLRPNRWVVMLQHPSDESRAYALAERLRYRHYVVAEGVEARPAKSQSLLAVVRVLGRVPEWLLRQLDLIRRVESIDEGRAGGAPWITPDAYWHDGRGGRSVWVKPEDQQFGAAAVQQRVQSITRRIAELDTQSSRLQDELLAIRRQLQAVQEAQRGQGAAAELLRRAEEFERARQQLPTLRAARQSAGERWQSLDAALRTLEQQLQQHRSEYERVQARLADHEGSSARHLRDWSQRRETLVQASTESRQRRAQFAPRWRSAEFIAALQTEFSNATQARLRLDAVQRELEQGSWETDATVEEKLALMRGSVLGKREELAQRQASNESARIAVSNARERYIDVLRSTVRRYRKNIVELGQLAGVEVQADLPLLDNDDVVLRQAELKVSFNFDGKGQIGLNDGEASGGQQVIKSLILLVGLLKDDETPGGFVFIDEPFAHLDVRNIQLVGHFLKSTRAQYVLTTPITHNVEVFEPADITLVTSKKPAGARWAPPIGVLQRRA